VTLRALAGRALTFAEVAEAIVGAWTPRPAPAPAPAADPSRFADAHWTWRR